MANVNRVMLVGRLTKDVELKYLQDGKPLAKMSIAINKKWKDHAGQDKEETCFVNTTVWGKTAENCAEYLTKGSSILLEGELRNNDWTDKDGKKRSQLEVTARNVQFLDRKANMQKPTEPSVPEEEQDSDIPF